MTEMSSKEETADLANLSVTVHGRVQGVYFRHFVRNAARRLGLTGYVRNLAGGDAVELQAEGARSQLQELLRQIRIGPPGARVTEVDEAWTDYSGGFADFSVWH
jgi:acylphosphatase